MKKLLSIAVLGLVLLSGCVKGFDGMEPEPTPEPTPTPTDLTADIKATNAITLPNQYN